MSKRDRSTSANDNTTIFDDFMDGYWNQMAPDLYADLDAALADFKAMEGERRFHQLQTTLSDLHRQGRFPPITEIRGAYQDPFWRPYGMILTAEDIMSCKAAL